MNEKELASKYGQMVLFMKDSGKMIKQMEREDSFTQMVIFMKGIGSMIKLKDSENILIWMGLNT